MKRQFFLELTEEDTKAFYDFCYQEGTTPAEVLEAFVNDLICGDASRGSDERMLAQNYFERCNLSLALEGETFLQWILATGYIDRADSEPMEEYIDRLEELDLDDCFNEYKYFIHKPEPKEEAFRQFAEYKEDLAKALKG